MRRDLEHFAGHRPLRRPSQPKQHWDFHQPERRLTTRRAGDIAPIRKKGCLNFLYIPHHGANQRGEQWWIRPEELYRGGRYDDDRSTRRRATGARPWRATARNVLVVFGITGDLAKVMTFRSLYRLETARDSSASCPIAEA